MRLWGEFLPIIKEDLYLNDSQKRASAETLAGIAIRRARPDDMGALMHVYSSARSYMAACGNPNQWNAAYPSRELLMDDMRKEQLYVCCAQDGRVCGAFVLALGDDPTYAAIEGGKWLNDEPYGTIHRVASDGSGRGLFAACMRFALERCAQLRIDTHEDNRVMRALIERSGFVRCGIIYVADGTPRIAYQYARSEP